MAQPWYPQARALIIRKTRKSLTESALQTFEDYVAVGDYAYLKAGAKREGRRKYTYTNGSEIIVEGLDRVGKVMSTEFDMIYIQEGIEVERADVDQLDTRLRNNRLPFQQLVMDTNPGGPLHWIKKRVDESGMLMLNSTHEDNPILYDPATQQWTAKGLAYLSRLDNLQGAEKERLRHGKWVSSAGLVYANLDYNLNITEEAEYQPGLETLWFIDDGYAHGDGPGHASYHPRVILVAQQTAVGGINVFAEYYRTLEHDYGASILEVRDYGYPKPEIAHIDASATVFRATLQNEYDIYCDHAQRPVEESTKVVRRLICDQNNQRLLKIHPRCVNLSREMFSLHFQPNVQAKGGEAKHVKVDDHGPDALRYGLWHLRYSLKEYEEDEDIFTA